MKKICQVLTVVLICLVWAHTAEACPNCKGTVEANSNYMALGFAWSIALMLGMPAVIVATWAIVLFRINRLCKSI